MQVVSVAGARSYPVYIGAGLLAQLGGLYRRHGLRGRALVVADEAVLALHGARALEALAASDVEAEVAPVPAGETSKTLAMADSLYQRLIEGGFGRDAVVVALGGGVVGDLAGFVAATYQRGVALVQVPTTLLAQVDSAVGGKTGVNHRLGKNLIGAFHPPALVAADLDALDTLPEREWWSGLAEVVKYGLIADRELFSRLERELEALRPGAALEGLVARCVEIKAGVVARDEREAGPREVLNFGHTLGHALESLTGYEHFRHGEAVFWGMLGEAYLSVRQGKLREVEFRRVERLIARVPTPPLPELDPDAFLAHVRRDKKRRGGRVRMVWLRHLGQCEVDAVSPEALGRVLPYWRGLAQAGARP